LDEAEDPPPSSIVSRRDTEEARKLAEVADQAVLSEDQTFSGNNLWSVVINFLTATPGRQNHTLHKRPQGSSETVSDDADPATSGYTLEPERHKSKLSRMYIFKQHDSKERDK